MKAAVNEKEPLVNPETLKSTREDVDIIDNSLIFVNDLLRNMLDTHRATHNQLEVIQQPVDLLRDVLEPVDSMLYRRGGTFDVFISCPENMVIKSDRVRLKQIVLNLGRNSAKFVGPKGFVRIRAEEVDGNVQISVEDSGPGLPQEKRDRMFSKFQVSLDTLYQGTVRIAPCTS